MKKIKDDQKAKRKKDGGENKISSKIKINSSGKKAIVFPEEFEEDLGMSIRMKPQPLNQSGKKSTEKKNKIG